jgi:hypothetical protein
MARCAELNWNIGLRRRMDTEALEEWGQLQSLVLNIQMKDVDDEVTWGLSSSKVYTTSYLYRFLTSGGVSPKVAKKLWKCRVPLKIRIFVWQALQDRFQTGQQLKARKWRGSERCFLCDELENVDHLFFICPLVEFFGHL